METNKDYLDLTEMLNLDELIKVSQKPTGGGCSNGSCEGAGSGCTNGTCLV